MKYIVGFKTAAFWQIEVEADSRDEAEQVATDLGFPQLCHQEEIELSEIWEFDYTQETDEEVDDD